MNILGFNVGHAASGQQSRDGGAALLVDGAVHGAIAEERLTRSKHCGGYQNSAERLLRSAGLTETELDLVVVSCYGDEPRLDHYADLGFASAQRIEMIPSHHLSHAYSAYFPSRFDDALILVADNEGNILGPRRHADLWKNAMERLTLFRGRGNHIELLERDMDGEDIVSLGEMYGNITRFVGFMTYLNAGKTMALASFGDSTRFAKVPLVACLPDGKLSCPMRNDYLNASAEIRRHFAAHGHPLPEQRDPNRTPLSELWQDIAAAAQTQLEDGLLHKVRHWVKKTGVRKLCLAGGVALNCVANRRLLDEAGLEQVYVQPNAGDQGQGLGNVLYGWHNLLDRTAAVSLPAGAAYLGFAYSRADCLTALAGYGDRLDYWQSDEVAAETARLLAQGSVVAWFQGRSEWGPRSLGNRSILADPRSLAMRDHVNAKVKHRESFRPFAPVVPLEAAPKYFQISGPCPTMTIAARVRRAACKQLRAVVHVDKTARVQTVTQDENPRLHALLYFFGSLTGVPVLLNTSFNDADEPIVETPADALHTFTKTSIDFLVLEDIIVKRKAL